MSSQRRSIAISLGLSVAFLAYVTITYWSGANVSGAQVVVSTAAGLAAGSLYAISASGLVVVYTTTGIFNFSHGAIGVVGAFIYWQLHQNADGPQLHSLLALAIVVLVVAPVIGILLDVVLMRRLRTAPLVVQLMVTVGLMVFFLVLVGYFFDASKVRSVDHFFGTEGFSIGPAKILWHRFIVIVTAIAIAIALRLLMFRTRLGIAMRAVVDNRDLTALTGARANQVSLFAWVLGSSLAALAGILIAPEVSFTPENLNFIIIIALAAAAFGQLKNLPLTVLGALIIGLLESYSRLWLTFGEDFRFASRGIAPLVLFAVVLALPQSRLEIGRVAHNLKPRERTTNWWEGLLGAFAIIVLVIVLSRGWLNFGVWDPGKWDSVGLNNGIAALVLALIALSLVPLTGWAGQVNFAPLAFAGFGAFIYLKLSGGSGDAYWIPLVGLLCAPLGALVALPAARLRGLYLALMSMAFAQLMAVLFFPHPRVFPLAEGGVQFKPLIMFGKTFDRREDYIILLGVVFGFTMFCLILLRRSRFGRRWMALNDSPAAAATVGINVVWTKVIVYALSAAMAGMAGVFWATSKGAIDGVRDFDLLVGFELVLLMAAAGMSMPAAGLFLAFRFIFSALASRLDATGNVDWLVWMFEEIFVPFGPGLLAIGMVANQRGAIFEMGKGFAPLLPWRHDAREEAAEEKAAKREVEIGRFGLDEPFTPEAVAAIDHQLGVLDELSHAENVKPVRAKLARSARV